jgi:alpha-galactosidase
MQQELVHLRAGGVSVVLQAAPGGPLPAVLHWGADLGDLTDADLVALAAAGAPLPHNTGPDDARRVSVLPLESDGWLGRPGLTGSRSGRGFSPEFTVTAVRRLSDTGDDASGVNVPVGTPAGDEESVTRDVPAGTPAGADDPAAQPLDGDIADAVRVLAADTVTGLRLRLDIELAASGLLRLRAAVTNTHPDGPYQLQDLHLALPVPARAVELLDLTGRHARERVPQRHPFVAGVHARESRQGRPGLDGPLILAAGVPGFGFERGDVWAVHLGWSGNQTLSAEAVQSGDRLLAGGELLLPGELDLGPGETYRTPWLYASVGDGLNAMAGRFHQFLRSRPQHPASPRKVVLNTWEAVTFDQRLDRLTALARAAARVGVERFVLDDGWFRGRRDDRAGLGDWQVDPDVWPNGLHPLIDVVHGLGMDFGLWVEPEMINLDSDLARAHPEWVFQAESGPGWTSRHQHVLDLGNPDAYRHISGCLHALLEEYPIAYLKWDHNRPVAHAGRYPGREPGVHRHTRAVYRLMDELRAAHPGLEIESCSSGGGRVDLGVLGHTDRVWTSDCIDALDRQQIQRYTQLVVPPERMGAHVSGPVPHSTGRRLELSLRGLTALWGHFGIEWDVAAAEPSELQALAVWVARYRELRPLLHTGTVVVADHPDPAVWVHGVVAPDRSRALYGVVAVDRSATWPPGPARLPGLAPDRRYRVVLLDPAGPDPFRGKGPDWCRTGVTLSGRVLAEAGVQLPPLGVGTGCLIELGPA